MIFTVRNGYRIVFSYWSFEEFLHLIYSLSKKTVNAEIPHISDYHYRCHNHEVI